MNIITLNKTRNSIIPLHDNGNLWQMKYTELPRVWGMRFNELTGTLERVGYLKNIPLATKPPEGMLPIHSLMRRCVVNDSGIIQYYLSTTNSAYKEDGVTASVLTGADGQVVVEIPDYYYRYHWAGNVHTWLMSDEPYDGFEYCPKMYVGAYPGVIQKSGIYTDGTGLSQYATGDKLSSVSGKKPVVYSTRAVFRTMAANRSAIFSQLDNLAWHRIFTMLFIEYGSWDSQAVVGAGNTSFAAWDYATCIGATGKSNALGNLSGGANTSGGAITDYVSYRGIEDFWGNLWQFIDGFNINNDGTSSKVYICDNHLLYADDTATNYTYVGDAAPTDGYGERLINSSRIIMPSKVGTNNIKDYYWTEFDTAPSGGWRLTRLGGVAAHGGLAGAGCVYAGFASSNAGANIGGRLKLNI